MVFKIFIPFLLFWTLNLSGQHKYILPQDEVLASKLVLDPTEVRENLFSTFPMAYTEGELNRLTHIFADNVAYSTCNSLTSGRVYTNWPEMDLYLNRVMENVIPKELRDDAVMRPYLLREGYFNASMGASGIMKINVGVWPYIESEASLAALIAHEVAHYYSHHSLKQFLRAQGYTKQLDLGTGGSGEKSRLKASREFELEADSLAHVWLSNSPYSIEGSVELIRILERLQNLDMKRSEDEWEPKATSHPLSDDRLALLMEVRKEQEGGGNQFIQSEELFQKLKKQAVIETMETKLRDFEFRTGVELAFKFHLFEPNEPIYVYYLMESIRRLCYQNNDNWSKNFITAGYYGERISPGQAEKKPITAHLFEKFDLDIMSMSPSELRAIQARFYWDGELKYQTYEEAFIFYYNLGKALNCEECHLSEALSQIGQPELMKNALKTYKKTEDPMYADFADILINERVYTGLEKKKLTVFDQFYGYINQGSEPIPVYISSNNGKRELKKFIEETMNNMDNRKMIYLPSLRESNMEEYVLLQELRDVSNQTFYSKGIKPELHLIDPRYIELFKKYEVEEIEFVTCEYTEFRKREKGIEEYENATNMSYSQLFNQKNSTRYFALFMSSIREVKEGRMRYLYYSDELKLKFNNESRPQIKTAIQSQLRTKDDRMIKSHYKYKRDGGY